MSAVVFSLFITRTRRSPPLRPIRPAELHVVVVTRASTQVPQIDPLFYKPRSRPKRTPI